MGHKPEPDDALTFLDPQIIECPFAAYDRLRDEQPVYRDPGTGFYVITRYEDVRAILLDPKTFGSEGYLAEVKKSVQADRAERMRRIYEEKGWVPSPALGFIDDPRHAEVRQIFERAFRASKIKALDPAIRTIAYELVDAVSPAGRCDFVEDIAIPLPLRVTGILAGIPETDLPRIRAWTEAFIRRFGLMLPEEEERACVEQEIEAQHYLKGVIDRLRREPDDTLLSDIVNTPMSDGKTLSDSELFAHLMADTLVGGSETTTSALASGVKLLCDRPDVWQLLKSDPDKYLRAFVEEVLRLESPVQGLFRVANQDVEMRGVHIPKGAVLNIRYAAANRDPSQFECPGELDATRRNSGSHLGFGSGIHHCVGAPLARRELHWGFRALLDRWDSLRLVPGQNDFTYAANLMLRRLRHLHIAFDAAVS